MAFREFAGLLALLGFVALALAAVPTPNEHGVIELTPADWQDVVMDPNFDVLVEFYDPMCSYCIAFAPIYEQLAETFKKEDSVRIARIDASRHKIDGWPVPGTPYLVFFPANQKGGIIFRDSRSQNKLTEFIIEHANHPIDIPIHYASLPVPKDNNGPVIEVVGSTWKEIVMNPNVDVFVNFYAPWCPYSQRLAPIWEELGKRLESQKDKIVIAKMDGTANEVPGLHIHAFPTITLYQAGSKPEFSYRGMRTVEALLEFAQQNAERSFLDPVTGKWSHEIPKDFKDRAVDVTEMNDANADKIMDLDKNIVVLYYASWDPHSQELFGIWTLLALEFENVVGVRIVQMDAAKSVLTKIPIYPTIRLYPAKRRNDEEFVEFKSKEKTLAAFKEWIADKAVKSTAEEVVIDHARATLDAIVNEEEKPKPTIQVVKAAKELERSATKGSDQGLIRQSLNYLDPEEYHIPKKEL